MSFYTLKAFFVCNFGNMSKTNFDPKPFGFSDWTKVQRETFANYANNDEIVIYAPTGSGKTIAFLLPLMQLIKDGGKDGGLQAVIFSPTRELALQIEQVFKSLKSGISITACYGGHSMKTEVQNLSANPSIIVGTPGRIVDHMHRGHIDMRSVEYFIIDEFDKCLEIGFLKEMEEVYSKFRKLKKGIYCSATPIEQFPSFIKLTNPVTIDVLDEMAEPEITFYSVDATRDRMHQMKQMIAHFKSEPTIIFANFRDDVVDLSNYFEDERIAVTAYHGGMEQDERERALIKFRNGSTPVLICTDLGARGLDIPMIKHIIHYQLPEKEDAFIHRNGRTARMSEDGNVYLFQQDEQDARYDLPSMTEKRFDGSMRYQTPEWTTVYFSAGKKDKINKIDLLGFICQKGGIEKKDVGTIAVLDHSSYVAIKRHLISGLLSELRNHKVKGQKLKISISR